MSTGIRRTVWTDFGGVLTPSPSESLTAFADSLGVTPSALLAGMRRVSARRGSDDILEPLEKLLLTEPEWSAEMSLELGFTVPEGALSGAWFTQRPVDIDWVEVLRSLGAEGTTVGLLSNMPPGWAAVWGQMVDPGLFSHTVLSSEVGCRKPEPEIFEVAAEVAGAAPEDCVLVDDLESNCRAAAAAGWDTVRFLNATQAKRELGAVLGVLP